MGTELTFGLLESVLASMHGISSGNRTRFQARLKNLHRLGFLPEVSAGKGKAGRYDARAVIYLGLACELLQLGMSPERAIDVIDSDEDAVASAISMAAGHMLGFYPRFDDDVEEDGIFLYLDPSPLAGLRDPDNADPAEETFFYAGKGVVRDIIRSWSSRHGRRLSLINMSALLHDLSSQFSEEWKTGFLRDAMLWAHPIIHNVEPYKEGDDPPFELLLNRAGNMEEAEVALQKFKQETGAPDIEIDALRDSLRRSFAAIEREGDSQ